MHDFRVGDAVLLDSRVKQIEKIFDAGRNRWVVARLENAVEQVVHETLQRYLHNKHNKNNRFIIELGNKVRQKNCRIVLTE